MFTVFKKISDVKVYVTVPALLFTLILMGSTALADSRDNELIVIDLIGEGPGALSFGEVSILDNPTGPDLLRLKIFNLPPNERFTVFLSRHHRPARLPAQFIGEFTTNKRGKGKLRLRAEIINAFASANQTEEDLRGEADVDGAGNLYFHFGGTANTIPLNWFRGYFVNLDPHNVFGPDEITPGGPPAFISYPELP